VNDFNPAELSTFTPKPIPWADFIAEILPLFSPPAVSRSHAAAIRRTIRHLEALGVASTGDLNLATVGKYMATRPASWSPHTMRSNLVRLQTLCTLAVQSGHLVVNPFAVRPISRLVRCGPPRGRRHLTREEIHGVLELMKTDCEMETGWNQWRSRRLYGLTALVAYTGLRRNEALRLHVADLDLEARLVHLVARDGRRFKTAASEQDVPLPPAVVPVLASWLEHRLDGPRGLEIDRSCRWAFPTCSRKAPWISGSPNSKALARLKAVGTRAGVPGLTFQRLRVSWATHAEFFGVPPAMISRVLRHLRTQTTIDHYRQADHTNMVEAVRNVVY
jgi:integrase